MIIVIGALDMFILAVSSGAVLTLMQSLSLCVVLLHVRCVLIFRSILYYIVKACVLISYCDMTAPSKFLVRMHV